jgi:hypothetical protein
MVMNQNISNLDSSYLSIPNEDMPCYNEACEQKSLISFANQDSVSMQKSYAQPKSSIGDFLEVGSGLTLATKHHKCEQFTARY